MLFPVYDHKKCQENVFSFPVLSLQQSERQWEFTVFQLWNMLDLKNISNDYWLLLVKCYHDCKWHANIWSMKWCKNKEDWVTVKKISNFKGKNFSKQANKKVALILLISCSGAFIITSQQVSTNSIFRFH